MTDFYAKQNDTLPALKVTLTETPKGGEAAAIDLSGAEKVDLVVREKGGNDPEPPKFKSECEIKDAEAGEVVYNWTAEDTDTSGEFYFEFEITWEGGGVETVPRQGYYILDVEDDLG